MMNAGMLRVMNDVESSVVHKLLAKKVDIVFSSLFWAAPKYPYQNSFIIVATWESGYIKMSRVRKRIILGVW